VIILDVMLPRLDGYQVCRRLREGQVWTPVLMLTAMDEDLDHAEGLDSGADDYLAKPFSYAVLLAHLRALTRRDLGSRPVLLVAGDLIIDPASRTVTRDGVILDLTSREVAVLEHLMRRWSRRVQGGAARPLLGLRLRRGPRGGRGPGAPAATQDRGAHERAADHHGAGRGLSRRQGPAVSGEAPRVRCRLRPRRTTLRARVTVVASLGITAAIVGGLLLLYQLQARSVRATIDNQLKTYATVLAQSSPDGTWPIPLPASSLDGSAEAQVITTGGQVLAATRKLAGLPAIYQLPAGATSPVRQVAAEGVVPTDIRVVAQRFTVAGQQVTIITGAGTALLETVDTEFLRLLLLGLPLILLLSAFAVWIVVGRSLGPVDRIRNAVEAITADDLSRRVPEPQTADEIGQLARTMNAILGRLDDSARTQRRFVADASHELRSPLAAIRTTLEVGLAHPETAPWPTIAHRAAQQSQRLEALIQQLLVLARTDDHTPSAHHDCVDVDVGTLLDRLHHDLSPTRPQLTVHPGDHGVVTGDPDGLARMLRNIVDNALRHARHSVQIHTTTTRATITITIDDDGPGVPTVDRDRIFDRFVRLDDSRERGTGGSGLGLAITHQIADAHHATITVSDSPHGGARFTVQLPVAPPCSSETAPSA